MRPSMIAARTLVVAATVFASIHAFSPALAQPKDAAKAASLLLMQEKLVDTLRRAAAGVLEEARVGQRTTRDVLDSEERLFSASEALSVARVEAGYAAPSLRQLDAVRLASTRAYIEVLRDRHRLVKDRFAVGEVTRTDVLEAEAALLSAEVREKQLAMQAEASDANK